MIVVIVVPYCQIEALKVIGPARHSSNNSFVIVFSTGGYASSNWSEDIDARLKKVES